MRRVGLLIAIALVPLMVAGIAPRALDAHGLGAPGQDHRVEVEPQLRRQMDADGAVGYLIYLRDRPDLSAASTMEWNERGRFVVEALQETAGRSQAGVIDYLDKQGATYRSYWIDNVILVESSSRAAFDGLAQFPQIHSLRARRTMALIEPTKGAAVLSPTAVEPNISHVRADQVWGVGYDGDGIVVANVDTGVRYTHEALQPQYRGSLGGGSYSHHYNWLGAVDGTSVPTDDHGHGSHTMGTMIGDDGGTNRIGMAPGARWIACDGCSSTSCPDAALLECAQWVAAPYPIGDPNSPDPDQRPHVVNNSWGDCGTSYDDWYRAVVDNWHSAGIYPVFSNGNASNCSYSYPPGLNTVGNPARYGNVTGVGSTGQSDGQYATHSNWGPTDNPDTVNPRGYPDLKPQVLAPGVNIRSSLQGSDADYGSWAGTSMSAPHVAGLVALMWQAAPCLVGDYAGTETVIEETATAIPYDDGTGGGAHVPNYAAGWGEIDALAAVQGAIALCGNSTLAGRVTQAALFNSSPNALAGDPIAGALLEAQGAAETRQATTDAQGYYTMTLFGGTYDVTASAYGYVPLTVASVDVSTGSVTTQDFALGPAATHDVSGRVTDATTGWPLYARIAIDGYPGDPVWTNPATGRYTISLAADIAYTFDVSAWVDGYTIASRAVGPLTGGSTEDFDLEADLEACTAPGYRVETTGLYEAFDDAIGPAGWTVVDNAGGGAVWRFDDPGERGNNSGGAGSFAIADSDHEGYVSMDTALRSPSVDLTGLTSPTLEFKYDFYWYSSGGTEVADVDVSVDGGGSWTGVWSRSGASDRGPKTAQVDISSLAAGESDVVVRFHYFGAHYDWYWQVDDVLVGRQRCYPRPGGLVVGNVYDGNLGAPLAGAIITNDDGETVISSSTGDDPAVDDGFYTLFSAAGSHTVTATMGSFGGSVANVNVLQDDTVGQDFYLAAGRLSAAPETLEVSLSLGGVTASPISLINDGGLAASFELQEYDVGHLPAVMLASATNGFPPGSTPPPLGRAPARDSKVAPVAAGKSGRFEVMGGSQAYGIDLAGEALVSFTVDNATALTVVAEAAGDFYAGDFLGGDFSILYVIDDATGILYALDTATGKLTAIGPSAAASGHVWTGMAGDPTTGVMYAVSSSGSVNTLYTLDLATGAPTTVGSASGGAIIDIAANSAGELYGVDIVSDDLVAIDKGTGQVTSIGSLGFDASYAQGMDFDEEADTLYLAAYNNSTSSAELRIADTGTGATTLVSTIGDGASVELDAFGIATGGLPPDVLWLVEDPITGTIPALSTQQITVSFDASGPEITQPGEYSARLRIVHDTPYLVADIPVTMTVEAPDPWGKLQGAVSGLGYCDAEPAALEQAEVLVESSTGVSWTVTTDADGIYRLWLDQDHSPVSIAATFPGHQPATVAEVTVNGGVTTTADLNLRWSEPCLAVEPSGLNATLEYGEKATLPITISNSGAAGLTYEMEEIDGGYTPAAATVEVLLLTPDSGASKLTGLLAGFSDLHVIRWDATTGAPTAADLASYDVVIFGNNTTWSSSGMDPIDVGNALADYIDGGGKAIDTLYTHSFDRWALGGRYLSEDYGPFATAANDYDTFPSMGTVYSPDHPIMDGVGTIVLDWLPSQYSHQDPGLAPGATRLADWEDNTVFIAYNDHVVGLNLQAFSLAAWSDACDMPELVRNSVLFLTGGAPTDLSWLSEEPDTGVLPADTGPVQVGVTLNAALAAQPGEHRATLRIISNDPVEGTRQIPVTMTIEGPESWGVLQGTVTSLGRCDANPTLLEGAELLIESGDAVSVTTGSDGTYLRWLVAGTYTMDVTAQNHEGDSAGVNITAQQMTTQDFSLRSLEPCISVSPPSLQVSLTPGSSRVRGLELINNGAGSSAFGLSERAGGFLPSLESAGEEMLLVAHDLDAAEALEAVLIALDRTYLEVSDGEFQALQVTELLGYQAVLHAGFTGTGGDPGASETLLLAYLDAGGSLLIADNDLGYWRHGYPFYETYLQALYLQDDPGMDSIVGEGIMAGLTLDVSADPFPDEFSVREEGTRIFRFDGGAAAGAAIDRSGYRAVYLSLDLDDVAAGADWQVIVERTLGFLGGGDRVTWLSQDPVGGVLGADSRTQVGITFTSLATTTLGTYTAILVVETSDLVSGRINLPVTLMVVDQLYLYFPIVMR